MGIQGGSRGSSPSLWGIIQFLGRSKLLSCGVLYSIMLTTTGHQPPACRRAPLQVTIPSQRRYVKYWEHLLRPEGVPGAVGPSGFLYSGFPCACPPNAGPNKGTGAAAGTPTAPVPVPLPGGSITSPLDFGSHSSCGDDAVASPGGARTGLQDPLLLPEEAAIPEEVEEGEAKEKGEGAEGVQRRGGAERVEEGVERPGEGSQEVAKGGKEPENGVEAGPGGKVAADVAPGDGGSESLPQARTRASPEKQPLEAPSHVGPTPGTQPVATPLNALEAMEAIEALDTMEQLAPAIGGGASVVESIEAMQELPPLVMRKLRRIRVYGVLSLALGGPEALEFSVATFAEVRRNPQP